MTVEEYFDKYDGDLMQRSDVKRFLEALKGLTGDFYVELNAELGDEKITKKRFRKALEAVSDKYDALVDLFMEKHAGYSPIVKGRFWHIAMTKYRHGGFEKVVEDNQ